MFQFKIGPRKRDQLAAAGGRYCNKTDCFQPPVGWGEAVIPGEWARQKGQHVSVTPHYTGEETGPQTGQVHSVMQGAGL